MFDVFFHKADDLNARRLPFAMAVVVRHEPPISGKPGDKAIIQADGSVFGWIGGGCTQPIIVEEAKYALADGQPRLVRIAPTASPEPQEGVVERTMTCHSGGTLEIYIEPVLPKPQLVIVGQSVVARTLAQLGRVLHYRVVAVAPDADADHFPGADAVFATLDAGGLAVTGPTFVVVSTQGEGDEQALAAALRLDVPYVAFVASRTKAERLFQDLQEEGVAADDLARVKVPAGLDIGARTSEEIAVSILAEIIQVQRSLTASAEETATAEEVAAADETAAAVEAASPDANAASEGSAETLHIDGMSCAHCVQTVRAALASIEGVAVDDVEIGTAAIRYDPAAVDREQVAAVLAQRGYAVHDGTRHAEETAP